MILRNAVGICNPKIIIKISLNRAKITSMHPFVRVLMKVFLEHFMKNQKGYKPFSNEFYISCENINVSRLCINLRYEKYFTLWLYILYRSNTRSLPNLKTVAHCLLTNRKKYRCILRSLIWDIFCNNCSPNDIWN